MSRLFLILDQGIRVFMRSMERFLFGGGEDVYFVSFPKAGRTWVRFMMAAFYSRTLQLPLPAVLAADKRSNVFPRAVRELRKRKIPYLRVNHGLHLNRIVEGGYFPRLYYKNERVVLLVRDPRDVLVSFYHHASFRTKTFKGPIREFIRLSSWGRDSLPITQRLFGIDAILAYMNSWAEHLPLFREFTILYYEDFIADPHGELTKLLTSIGVLADSSEIADAIEAGKFENMRELEKDPSFTWYPLSSPYHEQGMKMREGRVGGYKEALSSEDIAYIEERIHRFLHPVFSRYRYCTKL